MKIWPQLKKSYQYLNVSFMCILLSCIYCEMGLYFVTCLDTKHITWHMVPLFLYDRAKSALLGTPLPSNPNWSTEPSCSKLTMSLVNVLLKLWSWKYGIYAIIFAEKNMSSFCICKSYSHFFNKNICELDIVLTRTVNISTTNELVKLTMLWTTGPWSL